MFLFPKSPDRRVSRALILAIALFPLLIGGVAGAQSASDALPNSQGWFWDRPAPPPDPTGLLGDPVGQNIATQFEGDHVYVGWDPAGSADDPNEKREMITGIAFDFFRLDIPVGATITSFKLTALENRDARATNNEAEAETQGILACEWIEFFAGSAGTALSEAPPEDIHGGECEASFVEGIRSENPVRYNLHAWTFDITQMMNTMWSRGDNTAISLEPYVASENPSDLPWTTAFRASTFRTEETDDTPSESQPGIFASISWVAADPVGTDDGGGFDSFDTFDNETFDNDFGDAGGDFTDTGVTPPEPPESSGGPPVAVGPAQGASVSLWNIPVSAWLGALLGVIGLSFAGVALQGTPATGARSPGAVDAMMRGSTKIEDFE